MLALLHSDVASAILKRVACKSWRDLIPLACVSRGALSVVRVVILKEQRAEVVTLEFVSSLADECTMHMLQFVKRAADPAATSYIVPGRSIRMQHIARDDDLYGEVCGSWWLGGPACVTVSRMGVYCDVGRWKAGELDDRAEDNIDIKLTTTKSGTVCVFDQNPLNFHGLDELWGMLASALEVESFYWYK